MLNTPFTPSRILVGLAAGSALIVAACVAIGASLSTTILVVAMATTPAVVIALLARGAPSPSVAQILHDVTTEGRS
jgi:hypothetical protein